MDLYYDQFDILMKRNAFTRIYTKKESNMLIQGTFMTN